MKKHQGDVPTLIPARTHPCARLITITPSKNLIIPLQWGTNSIGRQQNGNHIILVGEDISRVHAEIFVSSDPILVRDMGSVNGTFVNGERIEVSPIQSGDVVSFSKHFSFYFSMDKNESISNPPFYITHGPHRNIRTQPGLGPDLDMTDPENADDGEGVPDEIAPDAYDIDTTIQDPWTRIEKENDALLAGQRERLAELYKLSQACMTAKNLDILEQLLIKQFHALGAFDRGFFTYRLPSNDWRLVLIPQGEHWDRKTIRHLLSMGLHAKKPIVVQDSATDLTLQYKTAGKQDPTVDLLRRPGDSRILLPLHTSLGSFGAVFLVADRSNHFSNARIEQLALFADIAALSISSHTQK